MNNEIFNKNGKLKARPPKRFCCKGCNNITSRPATAKFPGVSFHICEECGNSIRERDVYVEWQKRKSGQWDVEEEILSKLDGVEKTKKELSSEMMHVDDFLFSKSFAELCYWGKLNINKEHSPTKYSKKCT